MNDEDLELLRFEKTLWHHRGAKANAIKARFGLSETTYWQRLRWISRLPEALAAEPSVVNRLNRRWHLLR